MADPGYAYAFQAPHHPSQAQAPPQYYPTNAHSPHHQQQGAGSYWDSRHGHAHAASQTSASHGAYGSATTNASANSTQQMQGQQTQTQYAARQHTGPTSPSANASLQHHPSPTNGAMHHPSSSSATLHSTHALATHAHTEAHPAQTGTNANAQGGTTTTLLWSALEPWMDAEYARQVCALLRWEAVAWVPPASFAPLPTTAAPATLTAAATAAATGGTATATHTSTHTPAAAAPAPAAGAGGYGGNGGNTAAGGGANNAGYAVLTFSTREGAERALGMVNGTGNPTGTPMPMTMTMPNSARAFVLGWAPAGVVASTATANVGNNNATTALANNNANSNNGAGTAYAPYPNATNNGVGVSPTSPLSLSPTAVGPGVGNMMHHHGGAQGVHASMHAPVPAPGGVDANGHGHGQAHGMTLGAIGVGPSGAVGAVGVGANVIGGGGGPNPQYPKEYSIFVGDLAPETSNSDLVAVSDFGLLFLFRGFFFSLLDAARCTLRGRPFCCFPCIILLCGFFLGGGRAGGASLFS
ncbi:hypothetical protein C8F04DRAFT_636640 [Mycena alexandri]|uniref:Uncharacterized protein n=1 Tax=Mycena alexandri TaxID=1745969 RepID=A0AAD6SSU6_9AGAR|nr:hypothetical protein C8F04DRAFT_636640 [Mycena alexandri]